jgi:vacuolar-type H+-ATPase subunit I/STV1
MSECDGPCSDLPLEEIQTRFDAMEKLITTSRNQLQKASEIVNEMALEDPAELHSQKLFELEENLQATSYSLETMQIADLWENWDEPIEYIENTRKKRLYKIPLEDTILQVDSRSEFDDTVAYTQDEMNSAFHITSSIDRMLFDISSAKDFLRTHEPSYVPQSIENVFQLAMKYEEDLKYAIENTRDERVTKEYSIALEKIEILLGALQGYEELTSRYSATQSEQDKLITLLSDMESSLVFEKVYIESVLSDTPPTYN